MDNHMYQSQGVGLPCDACGKAWYHEEHFGGSREAAGRAVKEYTGDGEHLIQVGTNPDVWLGSLVRTTPLHPSWPGCEGIVTYAEEKFATVQFVGSMKHDILPQNIPWRFLVQIPEIIPKFTSQEEADDWLARRNPVTVSQPAVPRFTSQEAADAWLAEQESAQRPGSSGWAMGVGTNMSAPSAGMVALSGTAERAADKMDAFSMALTTGLITVDEVRRLHGHEE